MDDFYDQLKDVKDDIWWHQHYTKWYRCWVLTQMKGAVEGISKCGQYRTYEPRGELRGYVNMRIIQYCEKYIVEAKETYYKGEQTIMSDDRFDILERILKRLDPDNLLLQKVGV